jgi:hypothetical protein
MSTPERRERERLQLAQLREWINRPAYVNGIPTWWDAAANDRYHAQFEARAALARERRAAGLCPVCAAATPARCDHINRTGDRRRATADFRLEHLPGWPEGEDRHGPL